MRFYFQDTIEGSEETLALCSLYSPVDNSLRNSSHNALNVRSYSGQDQLIVLLTKCILLVVAMVPFSKQGGRTHFFVVEKFALGVIDTDDIQD